MLVLHGCCFFQDMQYNVEGLYPSLCH